MCCVYASKTRKEKFSGPVEHYEKNVTDLVGSLVTSSRQQGRPQKRPDDRTLNTGVEVRTADGGQQNDAADEQCLRCGCSSPPCTVVLCAAGVDGPLHTACTASAEGRPVSAQYVCQYVLYHSPAVKAMKNKIHRKLVQAIRVITGLTRTVVFSFSF